MRIPMVQEVIEECTDECRRGNLGNVQEVERVRQERKVRNKKWKHNYQWTDQNTTRYELPPQEIERAVEEMKNIELSTNVVETNELMNEVSPSAFISTFFDNFLHHWYSHFLAFFSFLAVFNSRVACLRLSSCSLLPWRVLVCLCHSLCLSSFPLMSSSSCSTSWDLTCSYGFSIVFCLFPQVCFAPIK